MRKLTKEKKNYDTERDNFNCDYIVHYFSSRTIYESKQITRDSDGNIY